MSVATHPVSASDYRRGVLLVTAAMFIWSSAGVLTRAVETDPWTTLFWRSVFAAVTLQIYLMWRSPRGWTAGFGRLGRVGVAMGLCFAASMIAFINALALTTVAAVLVFQAAAPLFAAVLAWFFLKEGVSRRTALAIAVSCIGVALIVGSSGEIGQLWGNLISAVMGLTYALTVVLARAERNVPTTEATQLGVLVTLLASLPLASFHVSLHDMFFLGVIGIFQMGLALIVFTNGVRLIPSADAGLISVLEAVLAPVWVWLVFAEDPGTMTLVGGGVVIAAVAWAATGERR